MNISRGMALNLLYMLFLAIGQLGNYVTSCVAYHYRRQYSYLVVMGMAIIGMLLVLLLMAPDRERERVELSLPPVGQAIPCALFFLSLCYILTYGKTYDWFSDVRFLWQVVSLYSLSVFIFCNSLSDGRL